MYLFLKLLIWHTVPEVPLCGGIPVGQTRLQGNGRPRSASPISNRRSAASRRSRQLFWRCVNISKEEQVVMGKAKDLIGDLQQRAQGGDRDAQRRLGDFWWFQQHNRSEAIKWWQLAADQGDHIAQQRMYKVLKNKTARDKDKIRDLKRDRHDRQESDSKGSEQGPLEKIIDGFRGLFGGK